jgi:hypothetical protein
VHLCNFPVLSFDHRDSVALISLEDALHLEFRHHNRAAALIGLPGS